MKQSVMVGLLVLVGLGVAHSATAQTVVPSSRLGWDEVAASNSEAGGFTYKYYPDGAATATTIGTATCTGGSSPFACTVPFPTFSPGSHTLQLTATNAAGESAKSAVFSFTVVAIPATPTNLRVQ